MHKKKHLSGHKSVQTYASPYWTVSITQAAKVASVYEISVCMQRRLQRSSRIIGQYLWSIYWCGIIFIGVQAGVKWPDKMRMLTHLLITNSNPSILWQFLCLIVFGIVSAIAIEKTFAKAQHPQNISCTHTHTYQEAILFSTGVFCPAYMLDAASHILRFILSCVHNHLYESGKE